MSTKIGHIALLVKDYDEAINFYVKKLGFNLLEDTPLDDNRRWILVSPNASQFTNLVLVKAITAEQKKAVGIQAGDGVFLYIYTENMKISFERLLTQNILIVSQPINEQWGKIAKFKDIYGNLIELIEPTS